LLEIWGELNKEQGLELLIGKYTDTKVREKAVSVLEKLTDQELAQYLAQLVQALRYEPYHDSALARLLMKRAIKSKWKIGHYFLWHLKSGLHELSVQIRFALILFVTLNNIGDYKLEFTKQIVACDVFTSVSADLAPMSREERRSNYKSLLSKASKHLPSSFILPLDSQIEVTNSLIIDNCKVMTSKMAPLWLNLFFFSFFFFFLFIFFLFFLGCHL
jgi:phosphatidylinositol-4,5-bisphosphate 3-kinase catalytic subunit gamma